MVGYVADGDTDVEKSVGERDSHRLVHSPCFEGELKPTLQRGFLQMRERLCLPLVRYALFLSGFQQQLEVAHCPAGLH